MTSLCQLVLGKELENQREVKSLYNAALTSKALGDSEISNARPKLLEQRRLLTDDQTDESHGQIFHQCSHVLVRDHPTQNPAEAPAQAPNPGKLRVIRHPFHFAYACGTIWVGMDPACRDCMVHAEKTQPT